MYKVDYHTHTNYSCDSNASIESMVLSAISKGFDEIAITDHVDYGEQYPLNYDEYIITFNKIKQKYAKEINIILGIEIGLDCNFRREIRNFTDKYPFDFIIGSSHAVKGIDLYFGDYFENKSKQDAYTLYFKDIIENINFSDEFCVYGHLDFISRYGKYKDNSLLYEDFSDIIDSVLKLLIENGKGIEINTSGYRYNINQSYPQFLILKRYKELGGEIITIGSDAHKPQDIGDHFDSAISMLKEAGFEYISIFRNKKPKFEKID